MTSRLTNDMRGQIVNAALMHRFIPIIGSLTHDYADFAKDVYNRAFKRDLSRIADIPEGWLPVDKYIQVEIGAGKMPRLHFNGQFVFRYGHETVDGVRHKEVDLHLLATWPKEVFLPFPAKKKGTCVISINARDPLAARYEALCYRKQDLIIGFYRAQKETASAVAQYTTIDKLIEAWPEIEPFTKGIAAKPKPQLPVVQISKLNALLDLPVSEDVQP